LFCWDEDKISDSSSRQFTAYFGWINKGDSGSLTGPICSALDVCNQIFLISSTGTQTPQPYRVPTYFPSGQSSTFPEVPLSVSWKTPSASVSSLAWTLNGSFVLADPSNSATKCPDTFKIIIDLVDPSLSKRALILPDSAQLLGVRSSIASEAGITQDRVEVTVPDPSVSALQITILPSSNSSSDGNQATTAAVAADLLSSDSANKDKSTPVTDALAVNGIQASPNPPTTSAPKALVGAPVKSSPGLASPLASIPTPTVGAVTPNLSSASKVGSSGFAVTVLICASCFSLIFQ